MTEGELYKKLNKEFEENFGRGDEGVGFIDVKEFLDLAKQDYPSLTELGMTPKLSVEDIEKVAIERQKWFEKWFGDGE